MESNVIYTDIKKHEDRLLSGRENMIRYCVDVEKMSLEEATEAVTDIIKAVTKFKATYDRISEIPEKDRAEELKKLLYESVGGSEEALEQIYESIVLLGCDCLDQISDKLEEETVEKVAKLRVEGLDSFRLRTREDKLELTVAAIEGVSDLVAVSIVADGEESTLSGNLQYEALAGYLSSKKEANGNEEKELSPYEAGISVCVKGELAAVAKEASSKAKKISIISSIIAGAAIVAAVVGIAVLANMLIANLGLGAFLTKHRRFIQIGLMSAVAGGALSLGIFSAPWSFLKRIIAKLLCKLTGTPYEEVEAFGDSGKDESEQLTVGEQEPVETQSAEVEAETPLTNA